MIRFYKDFKKHKKHKIKKGNEFIFESAGILYYYFMKIDMKRAESYTESPEWLINKRATINLKNEYINTLNMQ